MQQNDSRPQSTAQGVCRRRDFLASSAALAATISSATVSGAQSSNDKPNLLFILTDQWRASAFGHASDEVVRTPHIDQLASEGAVCSRAYAANPVCTPNRACLLTGRYSHQTGMITNNLMLPPEETCWPQIFAAAGYSTHYIGKWHIDGEAKPGYVPPGWRRRGFQTFQGFNRGHIYHRPWGFDDDGSELVPKDVASDPDYYEPEFQTDLAIRFIQQNHQQPFVCCLSLGPPHTPFTPPRRFDRYSPADVRLRPNVPERHQQRAKKDLAGYYGLCESLDHEVGRLMSFLRRSGLADTTLVVFTSDHGELAGSHGKYRKGEPEDESLNVPLIIRHPQKVAAGTTVNSLISSIDLMPSVLSLCGLTSPGTETGTDISAALLNSQAVSRPQNSIYCQGKLTGGTQEATDNKPARSNRHQPAAANAWRTLVTPTHKLTVRGGERRVEHLFDLTNDTFEMRNLAHDPAYRSLVDDLTDELLAHRDATGDSWPRTPTAAKQMYADPA